MDLDELILSRDYTGESEVCSSSVRDREIAASAKALWQGCGKCKGPVAAKN